ncbi:hypothetical protein XVE_3171 [Xanthomonas vesicatoria ATCC 35937]|uniref:Uncharacterized protein n=1 Tax=Xanthomonas vesicatoria ATCC 35937 TaxID=925775 RepID=F0BG07_9XANT|nr:hypothetical protein XVE_3171 [Xanthomonas vesicatoria ATCC 35937]
MAQTPVLLELTRLLLSQLANGLRLGEQSQVPTQQERLGQLRTKYPRQRQKKLRYVSAKLAVRVTVKSIWFTGINARLWFLGIQVAFFRHLLLNSAQSRSLKENVRRMVGVLVRSSTLNVQVQFSGNIKFI